VGGTYRFCKVDAEKGVARMKYFRPLFALILGVLAALPAVPSLAASSGTWTFTGSMPDAQAYDAATLLPSGQVLVVGGYETSAELYNPGTGTWTLTGPMNAARNLSTATLLTNGEVLVTGGNSNGPVASAELYNPATNTWTLTGSMHTARYQHTATLLQNGEVLVAGGYNQNVTNPFLTSAELYNPSTGTWTITGSLHSARIYDTTTLLTNGQVLAAGGYNTTPTAINILATAELYNPTTGKWTLTGKMHTPTTGAAAVLLASGQVLVAAGENYNNSLTTAELFNPTSGTWALTGSMHAARNQHTATLLANGQVLVAGGQNGTSFVASAELYNPSTAAWTTTGSLNTPRIEDTATLLQNGQVLVAAGQDKNYNYLASAELYTP
jgi:N-acetylneuraminic acid mutarotase